MHGSHLSLLFREDASVVTWGKDPVDSDWFPSPCWLFSGGQDFFKFSSSVWEVLGLLCGLQRFFSRRMVLFQLWCGFQAQAAGGLLPRQEALMEAPLRRVAGSQQFFSQLHVLATWNRSVLSKVNGNSVRPPMWTACTAYRSTGVREVFVEKDTELRGGLPQKAQQCAWAPCGEGVQVQAAYSVAAWPWAPEISTPFFPCENGRRARNLGEKQPISSPFLIKHALWCKIYDNMTDSMTLSTDTDGTTED